MIYIMEYINSDTIEQTIKERYILYLYITYLIAILCIVLQWFPYGTEINPVHSSITYS